MSLFGIVSQFPYASLYENTDKFITIVTGGRGSGKSYNVSVFLERLSFESGHKILFSRYTMASASMSIIPEFQEKIVSDVVSECFDVTKTDITNTYSDSVIMFRGIKTSSGVQTAKLKSIQGLTTFVCDEAEEWTSEEDFEKIMLSIRQKGIQNRIIIVMNPTDNNHWVYKRFIENTHKLVEIDGVQVQISTHPNVLHIHTTYLDNLENLSPEFLKEVEDMKENNPEKYAHVVIGRWTDVAEGAVFKKWGIVDEFPAWAKKVAIGLDFGYSVDCTAIVRCGIVDNAIYIDELDYRTGLLSTDIIQSLRKWNMKTIADSADPRLIQEIHNGGIKIYPVEKGAGSINAGIDKMQSMEIFVTKRSYNLQNELRNYVWDKDKDGRYINTPVDANNHCFRGDTLITTINGDIAIKDITEGDYVLTRKGYKKVLKKHCNGIKKVVEKELVIGFEKRTFFATLEHKFNVNGKWKKYGELTKGDKLFVLSSSTEDNLKDTQTGSTPIIITTSGKKMESVIKNSCIVKFINSIMAKFRTGKSFIISTTIHSTIQSKILRRLQGVNTVDYIRRKLTISSEWGLTRKAHIQNRIGRKEESKRLLDCNLLQGLACNAVLSWQDLTDVIIRGESYCEVYDLTIEDEHEFFANGVLVHNCIDAARYYVLGELLGKIQKPKDLTGIFTH